MVGIGVTVLMAAFEFVDVGVSTMFKAATDDGYLNQFVFIVYSNVLALFVLSPCCFFFYRRRSRPPIEWNIVSRIMLMSIVNCAIQMLFIVGLNYSSPTMNSAMLDLSPAYTFLLALLFRMEKLEYKLKSSQAKLIGTLVSISGALIITLYKGQPITVAEHQFNGQLEMSNWVIGGIFCAAGSFLLALTYIIQSWILKDYPEEMMVTFVGCAMLTGLSVPVSLGLAHDPSAWIIRMDIGLLTIAFNGILCVAFRAILHTWACREEGPVYVMMFKPLDMVFAMALGVLFLADTVFLGRVIGAVILTLGFYAAMWGKAQEHKAAVEDHHHHGESRVALMEDENSDVNGT